MTLKCIAGIERPDRGRIVVDGVTLFDSEKHIDLTPQRRRTGLMFQNYALFPNMTVAQNIRAGARRERDKAKREALAERLMESFQLQPLAKHYPSQLSGGQQQRVALARILVSDPQILLLDEPFSALDQHLRFRLERELHQTLREFGKTAIFVSHDRDEVYRLADRIVVMEHGRVETSGTKKDVFRDPHTRAAAALTGCKNISRVAMLPDGSFEAADWGITLRKPGFSGGCVGIRMHDVRPGRGENEVRLVPRFWLRQNACTRLTARPAVRGPGQCAVSLLVSRIPFVTITPDGCYESRILHIAFPFCGAKWEPFHLTCAAEMNSALRQSFGSAKTLVRA